ncbi:MAG: response regulator [Blastocatellia bacterium]|nr:response regulator [Blastocatellia bacterium]
MSLQSHEKIWQLIPGDVSHQQGNPLVDSHAPAKEFPAILSYLNSFQDVVMVLEGSHSYGREPWIASVNQAFEDLTGYALEEAVGHPLTFLHGPQTRLTTWNRLKTALLHYEPIREELAFYNKNGDVFWLELDLAPLGRIEQDTMQWLLIGRNVTGRKTLENQVKEQDSLEKVRQLSAGVAHNFNNLLMVLMGYSEMLLGKFPVDDPKRTMIAKIQETTQQMAQITSQLVAFGQTSSSNPKPVDLSQEVAQQKSRIQGLLGDQITVSTNLRPNLATVLIDPSQLEQALVQLSLNAREAMPNGGTLSFETNVVFLDRETALHQLDCKPGFYIELLVSDTGKGMKPEVKTHVFEPFFTTKGAWEGSGLGLSTVYGIVKQNGGVIEVSSQEQCGTQFRLMFPVSLPQAADSQDLSGQTEVDKSVILLIEDTAEVRELLHYELESKGYTVLAAAHGREAIRLASQCPHPIHFVLSDVMMPGMNTRNMVDQLNKLQPGIRYLFMSGFSQEILEQHDLQAPTGCFLQKPFTSEEMNLKLNQLFNH